MIVGISGKKQHGKDVTAKVLNWIFTSKRMGLDGDYPMLYDYVNGGVRLESDWKTIKFADKLKDIICMLTGCTRAQLEDDAFKNSYMPVQWNRRVHGTYASCGGQFMQDDAFYRKYNPKYHGIEYDNPDRLEVKLYNDAKHNHDNGWLDSFDGMKYRDRKYCIQERRTYRDALQEIGTDLFRNQFNKNTWVDATMADYKPMSYTFWNIGDMAKKLVEESEVGKNTKPIYPNWFISDVRFPGEVEAIKAHGGVVIRINRPEVISTDTHESETALDNYQGFDAVVENDGDLFNLFHSLVEVVDLLKL